MLTDIDLTIGKVNAASATSSRCASTTSSSTAPTRDATAHVAANPQVRNVVDGYNTAVSPLANAVIGTIAAQVNNTADTGGTRPAGA